MRAELRIFFDHLEGLTGISDAQLAEHLDLYAGYVKQVNTLMQELSEMRGELRIFFTTSN